MYPYCFHLIYFKFKQNYQQYGSCFQTIFPFLMTMFRVTIRLWSFVTLNKIYLQNFWFKSCYFNLRYAAHSHYSLKKIPRKKHPCKGIMWKIVIFAKSKKQSFKFNKYFVVYYPALAGWFYCLVPRGKRVNESILFQSFYRFYVFLNFLNAIPKSWRGHSKINLIFF